MATNNREPRQIEVMKDQFLFCRSERHMWDMVGDRDVAVNRAGYVVRFVRHTKCLRCNSEKFQPFLLPGWIRPSKPRIIYSKDYLSREGRIAVDDVREEQLSRSGLRIARARVPKTQEKGPSEQQKAANF